MDELNEQYNQLFNPQGDLTAEALWAYTHSGLTAEEMQAVQQHLAGCEMCQDAAEGVAMMGNKELYFNTIHTLNQKVNEQVEEKKKRVFMWGYQRLAIAAILLVLLGISFVWFNSRNNVADDKTVAANQETIDKKPQLNSTHSANETQSPAIGNSTKSDSGTLNLTTTNGASGSYTYAWTTPKQRKDSISEKSGLATSQYTVTLADGNSKNLIDKDSLGTTSGAIVTTQSTAFGATAPAPSANDNKSDLREMAKEKSVSGARRNSKAEAEESQTFKDKENEGYLESKSDASASPDDIEGQYPGGTDYIQHYIDSLRPNKTKPSRYPITVRLTVGVTGDVSTVDFVHAPGINPKEKGQLETVLKSLPFWKTRSRHYSRPKKISVTFNY